MHLLFHDFYKIDRYRDLRSKVLNSIDAFLMRELARMMSR